MFAVTPPQRDVSDTSLLCFQWCASRNDREYQICSFRWQMYWQVSDTYCVYIHIWMRPETDQRVEDPIPCAFSCLHVQTLIRSVLHVCKNIWIGSLLAGSVNAALLFHQHMHILPSGPPAVLHHLYKREPVQKTAFDLWVWSQLRCSLLQNLRDDNGNGWISLGSLSNLMFPPVYKQTHKYFSINCTHANI